MAVWNGEGGTMEAGSRTKVQLHRWRMVHQGCYWATWDQPLARYIEGVDKVFSFIKFEVGDGA